MAETQFPNYFESPSARRTGIRASSEDGDSRGRFEHGNQLSGIIGSGIAAQVLKDETMLQHIQRIEIPLKIGSREFQFRVCASRLELSAENSVQYYWMDSSALRSMKSREAIQNFNSCIGHWITAMTLHGDDNDLNDQVNLVFATCYPLFARSKSLQDVFKDAYLCPERHRSGKQSIPEETLDRISDIVKARDSSGVRQEMNQTLSRFAPPEILLPLLQEACREWLGKGVECLRKNGAEGLAGFRKELQIWAQRLRKKGGNIWVRHFLNMFAYESKVAFYTCVANAWIGLIPWLRENRSLDQCSERFLRFWHNQNQPVGVPYGKTAGGIYYPTMSRAAIRTRGSTGKIEEHSIGWQNKQIGPTHIPDAFSGQLLSLHPIGWTFLTDPDLTRTAADFFFSDAYDDVMVRGNNSRSEYWNLVRAILIAAHQYRQVLDRENQSRRKTLQQTNFESEPDEPPIRDGTEAGFLEEFMESNGRLCPKCGQRLTCRSHRRCPKSKDCIIAQFFCSPCKTILRPTISMQDVKKWAMGNRT